jgi:hypothetical protein
VAQAEIMENSSGHLGIASATLNSVSKYEVFMRLGFRASAS